MSRDELNKQVTQENDDQQSAMISTITDLVSRSKNLPLNSFYYMLIAFVGSLLGLHLIIRLFASEISRHVFGSG
jgi:hypothetical protein